ncbi:hypothetical protein GR140_18960 [Pseudomonas putida]|uniref:hypothetical protein n=1 Tax=Pseudomonas putida TaxID=303 RepID=UPI001BB027B2|nr:hypothetical protein [Pseudomonas putida]QUG90746.1 hypothetical protein GR140_18960 [Pseudomonas putida]
MTNNTNNNTENTSIGLTFPITKLVLTSWKTYACITTQLLMIAACSIFEINDLQQILISFLLASTISMLAIMFLYDFTSNENFIKTTIYIRNMGSKETDKIQARDKKEADELLHKIKEQALKEDNYGRK